MRSGSGLPGKTGTFTVGHFHADADFAHLRWTLDTAKDYEFFCALSQHEIQDRGWQDIIALMMKHPELLMWNRGYYKQKDGPGCDWPAITPGLQKIGSSSCAGAREHSGWQPDIFKELSWLGSRTVSCLCGQDPVPY